MRTTLRTSSLISLALSTQNREAALLRATTDLFAHGGHHTSDEIQRFEELAIHFLPKVLVSDRAYVAESLSNRVDAPAAVLRQLAKDLIEVAAPVLKRARVLSADELLDVVENTGPLHHRMLATRKNLPPEVEQALRERQDAVTVALLDGPIATVAADTQPDRQMAVEAPAEQSAEAEGEGYGGSVSSDDGLWETDAEVEEITDAHYAEHRPPVDLHEATDRFLELDRVGRNGILAALSEGSVRSPKLTPREQFDIALNAAQKAGQIPGLARAKRKDALIAAFADGLSLDPDLVARMVDDPSGEPLVLLVKAIGLSDAEARQVLLLANPAIGLAVQTFFRLVDLHASMEPAVADAMVAAWRGDGRASTRQPHVPQLSDAEGVRRPGARTQQRPSRRETEFLRRRGG
jgi:hypothetical protein